MNLSRMQATVPRRTRSHRVVSHDHRRSVAGARRRQGRLDARRDGLHALRDGHRRAAYVLQHQRRDGWPSRHGDATDVGRRRDPVRRGLGSSGSDARADGDDSSLLVRLAWSGNLTDIAATAPVARTARHRHGRRMGLGRGPDQRDMATGPSQQGHQHHAVGLGHRLHRRGADSGARARRARRRARDVAVAVRRRRAAGALHALDPASRA